MIRIPGTIAALTLMTGLLAAAQIQCEACSVPVFRYALEKWSADPYEVLLFHRGTLSEPQTALLEKFTSQTLDGRTLANVRLTTVDLEQSPTAEQLALWEPFKDKPAPWLVILMPRRAGPRVPVWSGELNSENIDLLLVSPARSQLAERILKGDSVVWVLLESGNKEVDDTTFDTLTLELDRLQQTLKLPELAPEDVQELGIESGSLKLAFSAIRVSKQDPEDRMLVDMLLRIEPDLLDEEYAEMPMAFPVFGRGRVLHALVGAGISAALIEDSSRFLTGACQCTVKAENPGVDLLMSVDWDGLVQPTAEKQTDLPPLAGLTGFVPEPISADVSPTVTSAKAPDSPSTDGEQLVASREASASAGDESNAASDTTLTEAQAPTPSDAGRFTPSVIPSESRNTVGRNAILMVAVLGVIILVATSVFGRKPL